MWFRGTDRTSDLVGGRQAASFLTLSGLAGHAELPAPRGNGTSTPRKPRAATPKATSKKVADAPSVTVSTPSALEPAPPVSKRHSADVGLTVRIEVNLPAGGDADTYDAIFASIKRHLIP